MDFRKWLLPRLFDIDCETRPAPDSDQAMFQVESLESRLMLSSVHIFAAGQTGTETLQLKINDVLVATYENVSGNVATREFESLSYESAEELSGSDIRLEFVNDFYDPESNFDRNIVIDRIEIDGAVYQSESPSTYTTGIWSQGGVTSPGFLETETLNINGSFFYSDEGITPSAGTRLKIRARGETGSEQMQVLVEERVLSTTQVAAEWDSYFIDLGMEVSVSQIRIEFINDLYDPAAGVDRNLVVEKIELVQPGSPNVETYFADAPTTFSNATWLPDDGIVEGFGRGNTLHTNGFFRFAHAASELLQLDASFGEGGFAAFPNSSFSSVSAVSPTGRTATIVGQGNPATGTSTLELVILDADGSVVNQTTIGSGGRQAPRIVSIQFSQDDSIFINLDFPRSPATFIYKFDANGEFDSTFGTNGQLRLDRIFPAKLALGVDGGVVVAGSRLDSGQLTVTRYNSDGSVDRSFGDQGIVQPGFGTNVIGVEINENGNVFLVVTDSSNGSRTVTKLFANGTVDLSYGVNGNVFLPSQQLDGARAVTLDSMDRVILSSLFFGDRTEVLRIDSTGQVDTRFGVSGTATIGADFWNIRVDAQDRILGSRNEVVDEQLLIGVFRLNESGNFDASFGDDGVFTTAVSDTFNDSNLRISNLHIGADGTIFAKSITGFRKYLLTSN